ncbi:ABC transporter permease [Actinomadura violacea]|uniref:ABC transporter permease n=1 Tax=Actinomadura violacea TaxID=2819934 RepID=A0ABS3RMC4_9ACTN|nr:FtsX-like permease family protein [Actinomadura violacea]MBO2457698.1 ABC transporter permease [Actinomadura violacea]
MGRILLVLRLVAADVRRHPAQAAMMLMTITAATAALSLGMSLRGTTDTLYRQTRAATAGPDVVALTPGGDKAATSALRSLTRAPEVTAHSGPHRQYYTTVTAHGLTSAAVAQGAGAAPGPVDRPLVTSGTWVRPGGVVVERGFAAALRVRVGDRVTVAGRSLPVTGIAVGAGHPVYPGAQMMGPGGGPSDYSGLVWMSEADTGPLAAAGLPVTSLLYLDLRDPAAAQEFVESRRQFGDEHQTNFFTWQFMAEDDARILRQGQPVLVIGSWLLALLAVGGVATLAAGRAAKQTRRVGLLKAVGATPGLIAAVLLGEYLTLALIADALGLAIARLAAPGLANPTASLLTAAAGPSDDTVAATTCVALAMAVLTTLGPTRRALRTETVSALADTARRPGHRPWLNGLSALLPTPLLLALRLIARRPGRAVLHAWSIAVMMIGATALLMARVQTDFDYGLGSSHLGNVQREQGHNVLLAVTAALAALAAVNIVTITWTTALEARPVMAIARTLGATPGQITAGLSAAQLLPTVPGAVLGVPLGLFLVLSLSPQNTVVPPTWWLFIPVLVAPLATAALTAVPARLAARRSVARTLSVETG